MICKVPAVLDKKLAHAEARRGYQIRKSKELCIFTKAQKVIRCGDYASKHLRVYRARSGGVGIKWAGKVVYHAMTPTRVTECHLDYAWVDALDIALAQEQKEQREVKQETAELVSEIKSLTSSFG